MNQFMKIAVEQAKLASKMGDVPVGCVIVNNGNVISVNYNRKNIDKVAVYHAEILCIIETCKLLRSNYLNDCDLYVTLRPCDMCFNAIAEARIRNVYYLLDSNYFDNLNANCQKINVNKLNDVYNYENFFKNFFLGVRNKL